MRREEAGATTKWLLVVGAVVVLSACAVEPGPPSGGYYAWYEGPYYPWFYPEYYSWPSVTVEQWRRYGGWHGGPHAHAHGVPPGGGHGGRHGVVPPGENYSSMHRNAGPSPEEG